MNQKKSLVILCCLASILGFGELNLKSQLKDINVASTESEQSLEVPLEEIFSESDTDVLQLGYAQDEIVYPVEESNFEEVFGSHP